MDKPLVLLLDDERRIREALPLELEPKFEVICTATLREAIEKIESSERAVDIALVDMRLGDDWEGGLKAIRAIHSLLEPPEIIVLTAYGSQENTVKCMEAGAFSYVDKSGRSPGAGGTELLIATIRRALEKRAFQQHAQKMERQAQEIKANYATGLARCIAAVIDAHEPFTTGRSERVAECARIIAEEYGLSPQACEEVKMAGYIHDIGMVSIDPHLLQRRGLLTNIEFTFVQGHLHEAERILQSIPELQHLLPAIVDHHEHYAGGGYPKGKRGGEISIRGRVLALADSFDAMVSQRPYQSTLSLDDAYQTITMPHKPRHRLGQFSPAVVDAFKRGFSRIKALYEPFTFEDDQQYETELVLVFIDIVESTSLMNSVGNSRYADALDQKYYPRLQRLVESNEGLTIDCIGDGAFLIFIEEENAVNFAISFQKSLVNAPILDSDLQVRIGIHTNKVIVQQRQNNKKIIGSGVSLTNRLEDIAGRGEVVISEQVYRIISETLKAYFKRARSFIPKGFPFTIEPWIYHVQNEYDDRLEPLHIIKRFFEELEFIVKPLPKNISLLYSKDSQFLGVLAVWHHIQDKTFNHIDTTVPHLKYRSPDSVRVFIVYKDQKPTNQYCQTWQEKWDCEIIPISLSMLAETQSPEDRKRVLREMKLIGES